ncbi:MAG: hypothetical protein E4G95_04585 [Bacteroidia bacterium]|nr:MAG: hypothetical protein E4G95_04585 [Bacteroidia bacterium]
MHVILYSRPLISSTIKRGRNWLRPAIVILSLLGLFTSWVSGQGSADHYQERISTLFTSITSSGSDVGRDKLADTLSLVVEQYLSEGFPFEHKFEGVKYIGQLFTDDSLVKALSWNIAFLDGTNRYTCFIVSKEGSGTRVLHLDSSEGLAAVSADSLINSEKWYGALYYDIIPFTSGDRSFYILLGFDMNGMFTNSKVIDILWFGDAGAAGFGAPLIRSGNTVRHRLIFNYSSEVSMMLRADKEKNRIIFDHLSPADPGFTGVYQYYGPDSSYDALELRDGIWWLVEDIDLRNREEGKKK